MKRTLVKMMLVGAMSAIAGQSWAESTPASIKTGDITGGSVEIYGDDHGSIDKQSYIYEANAGATVYIVATAYSTFNNNGIEWHVVKSTSSNNAQSRSETPGYTAEIEVTPIDLKTYKFSMPTDGSNVTVNAIFPAKQTAKVSYIDPTKPAGQQECTHIAYILEGTETELGVEDLEDMETWYVCPPAADVNNGAGLTYAEPIRTIGDVHLILADGCKMSVGSAASPLSDNAIYEGSGSFTIFGQTAGSGTLAAYSLPPALYSYEGGITINGGSIKAVATEGPGIGTNQDIAINGGKVTAIGKDYGISSGSGNITLGWSHPDDYIYASGYSCTNGNLKTAAGKRFVAFDTQKQQGDEGFDPAKTDITASAVIGPVDNQTIVKKTLRPLVYKELNGQVVTDFSPGYLLSFDRDDMKPASKATADFTIGTKPYYIFKASTAQNPFTVTISYSGTDFVTLGGLPEGTTFSNVENEPMQHSFAMPAQDVTLTTTPVTGFTASGKYTYTGLPQTPAISLGESAFEATNYTVTGITPKEGSNSQLTDGSAVNAGEYTIAIAGLGQYIGTASVDFTIGKATVKASGFTVKDKEKNGDDVTAVLNTTNVMLDGVITGSGDKQGDDVDITGVTGTFEDANVGENKTVNLDYTYASLTGKDAGNYALDEAHSQQTATGKILSGITVDDDGNVIETTETVIKDDDGNIIGTIKTTKKTKKAADGSATGTIEEKARDGNGKTFATSEGEIKVVVANGITTETTIRTDKDHAGNIIQTTETVKTTEKDADGNITVTIKEELTEANGQKIRYTETVKKTVKDADGNTTETINEIVSEPYLNPIRTIETKKEIVKTPDGQKTETINETVTEANGNITTTTIETKTDGSLQETKTVTHADKSVTETVIETVKNADGSKSITITNTEKDAGGETTETKEIHQKIVNVNSNTETVEETIKAADGTTSTTTSTITKTTEWDGYDPIKHPLSEKTLKTVKNADESEIGSSHTVKRLYLDVHFNVYNTIETIEEKWKYPDGSSIETKEVTETNAIGVVIKHSKKQTKTDALGNQTEISEVSLVNGSQDDISGVSNAQLGIQEGPADRVSLVSEGTNGNMQQSINVSQGSAVQIAVMGAKAGGSMKMDFMPKMGSPEVYASNDEVRRIVHNSLCRARGTEDEMIEIVSGEEYLVLKDGPLVLTFDVEEGSISIENITLKDPDPNDLNLDGKVNAVDLVKAITTGKTQAEIDEIVNSIMNIK